MSNNVTIYDLLSKLKVSDVTTTQLNSAAKNSALTPENVDFWAGIITVARAIEESRTYNGLPIPESGAMQTVTVADGAAESIKPTGSEVWLIQSVSDDNCTPYLTDGSGIMPLDYGGATPSISGPVYITAELWIGFSNSSGSEQTPGLAYHKVSL
tara:strand:- start:922 stop:1386 length:465 start_codon:yes stop_codon:yes gene_type:complete